MCTALGLQVCIARIDAMFRPCNTFGCFILRVNSDKLIGMKGALLIVECSLSKLRWCIGLAPSCLAASIGRQRATRLRDRRNGLRLGKHNTQMDA